MIEKNTNGKQIKSIIFDFGGVLLDLHMKETYTALSSLLARDLNPTTVTEDSMSFMFEFERGKIRYETWLWNLQRLSTGKIPQPKELLNAWNKMLGGWQQSKLDFLTIIKDQLPVFLLSNTNEVHLDWVYRDLNANHNISDFDSRFFTKTYYSHLIGMRKPDVEIFEFISNDSNLTPSETLFVDDNSDNIATAKALGFQTVLHECNSPLDYLFDLIK